MITPIPHDRKTKAASATLLLAEREAMRGLGNAEYAAWGKEIAGMAVVELRGARLQVTAGDGFEYYLRELTEVAGHHEMRHLTREEAVAVVAEDVRS